MKNTFIALAAALACSSAAYAQSNVQLTGLVDMYAGSMKAPGGERSGQVGSGGMTTSWWGLKGTEDLGSGLKADFNLTAFFRGDTGTPGRFNGDPFFARDANVGLSGSFGRVGLGRDKAPNFLPTILTNPFGDSFTISPLVLHANVGTGAWGKNNLTSPADTGWSNQIAYSTPDIGGFKANLQYQFGEQTGNNSKKNVGANFFYFGGPLSLTGFYERAQISNPGSGTYLGTTKTAWMLGGAYDLKMVKPYLSYGQSEADNTDITAKTLQVGASVPLGAGALVGSWAKTKLSGADMNRKTLTVGYDYNLSKRTDVYAMVMNDKITTYNSGTSYGVGIRHRF